MACGFSEWDFCEMVFWKAYRQHSHVAVGFHPLTMVLEHATAGGGAMQAEGMTAYPAEKFGEDCLRQCRSGCPVFPKLMFE